MEFLLSSFLFYNHIWLCKAISDLVIDPRHPQPVSRHLISLLKKKAEAFYDIYHLCKLIQLTNLKQIKGLGSCLKNKPAILNRKPVYSTMFLHDISHTLCAKTMPLFFGQRQALIKAWFCLIAVANIKAELAVFRKHSQADLAVFAVRYAFTGLDGIFQSI